jgi:hypothetical protein
MQDPPAAGPPSTREGYLTLPSHGGRIYARLQGNTASLLLASGPLDNIAQRTLEIRGVARKGVLLRSDGAEVEWSGETAEDSLEWERAFSSMLEFHAAREALITPTLRGDVLESLMPASETGALSQSGGVLACGR